MASSRVMRKSPRNASPMNSSAQRSMVSGSALDVAKEKDDPNEEWVEPTLRAPAPSFEDHRGLERHGVLEQMAPLGTLPTQKVRLRVKQPEPPEKKVSSKRASAGDAIVAGAGGKEASRTIEGTEKRRRSESHNIEDRNNRQPSLRDRDDGDYAPKLTIRPTSSRSSLVRPSSSSNLIKPDSNTVQGREVLRQVVEAAVERSRELGNELLGLAIRKLFQDSLHDRELAQILDSVLGQSPSPEHAAAFQARIRIARREIKNNNNDLTPSTSTAMAPTAPNSSAPKSLNKRSRRSTSRHGASRIEKPERTITPSKKSQANGKMAKTNGVTDGQPPSKKMKRSGSVSTQSSLSSTHSTDVEDMANEASEAPSLRSRGNGKPRLHIFSSSGKKAMAAAAAAAAGSKRSFAASSATDKGAASEDPEDAELARKKQKMKETFPDYESKNSAIRKAPAPVPRSQVKRSAKLQTPVSTRSKAQEDPFHAMSRASSQDILIPPPPGRRRTSTSRGTTPNALGRPKNATQKMARVKHSPNKKKTGVIAGIARGNRTLREREKEVEVAIASGDSEDSEDGENHDFCDSCGGGGELLCCDGCIRSFHFQCLDPPLNSDTPPEGQWFCAVCEARREAKRGAPSRLTPGLYAMAERYMAEHNPHAFSLPLHLREYFDSVKAGDEGEYDEPSIIIKPKSLRSLGHDDPGKIKENPNLRIRDEKGNVILCFKCGKSALGHREIISCDYCTLKWHLDCLNPPLANPPVRLPNDPDKSHNSWMCPAHSTLELSTTGRGGRAHKIRRPKNAKVVDCMMRRGFKNRGLIEIENDPSDDEMGYDVEDNVVYRVSERSIKLDFIDRVYKLREQEEQKKAAQAEVEREAARRKSAAIHERNVAFNNRSFIEKDAALSLVQFAQARPVPGLEVDQIQPLINNLISNAPDSAVALITVSETAVSSDSEAKTPVPADTNGTRSMAPTPPVSDNQDRTLSDKQKQSYMLLMDLIQSRLQEAEAESDRLKD